MSFLVKYKSWLVLCLASMLLVAVDCWVVRINCLSDENRLPFTVISEGKALEDHVIKTIGNRTMTECENECYDEFACKSINWSRDNVCELNSELEETKPNELNVKVGWVYRSTNYKTKDIGPVCQELSPCHEATFCIDTCYHPGYRCVTCPKYHELRYEQYCQLKAFVDRFYELKNIALGKPSYQSSKHHNHAPENVNGNVETCQTQSISHSKKNNYWMVDLERRAVVLIVTVMATKPSQEHTTHFTIKVGDQDDNYGDKNSHCVHNQPLPYDTMQNYTCALENEGRFVTIHQHNGNHHRHLRLCYVKVFGIYL